MLTFPQIDPVLLEIGPLAIRWYSLAYIAGILLGCLYADYLNKKPPVQKNLKVFDDYMMWAILGIILGGRLGYTIFYNFSYYSSNPLEILQVWNGGMSFHGGLLGITIATIIFARRKKVQLLPLFDLMACAAPIGIFFGRMANFINGELYGRATDVPWAMVFPTSNDGLPRHPSQLYEAFLEGLLLFFILFILANYTKIRQKPGILAGIFLLAYASARSFVELFREPDAHIGLLFNTITTGQLLSLPMIILGIFFIIFASKRQNNAPN